MALLIEKSKGRQVEVPGNGLRYHLDGTYKAEEDEKTRLFAVRLGRRLSRFRKEAGPSHEELAKAGALQLQTVIDVEMGRYFPSYEAVKKLAAALGRDSDDLLLNRRRRSPKNTS